MKYFYDLQSLSYLTIFITYLISSPYNILSETQCISDSKSKQLYDNTVWNITNNYDIIQSNEYDSPSINLDSDIQQKLSNMSLKEKIGQMMQLQISQFIGCDGLLNTTKLIDAIDTWKIGSIFETPGNQGGLYAWYTPPKLAE